MKTVLRYLTKQKFDWLFLDKGIYVGAASNQSDHHEGIYDHTIISQALKRDPRIDLDDIAINGLDDLCRGLMYNHRETHFISSWYLGDNEDFEMWAEYASDGVLIVSSTLHLLMHAPDPLNHAIKHETAIYDDEAKKLAINNPFAFKNTKFRHENEFRLVFNALEYSILTGFEADIFGTVIVGGKPSYESEEINVSISENGRKNAFRVISRKGDGYILKYDLNKLIQEVRVHPNSKDTQLEEIRLICSQAGLEAPVVRSKLASAL
jgi:hypothetical protein